MKRFVWRLTLLFLTSATSIIAAYTFMMCTSTSLTRLASEVFYVIKKSDKHSGCPAVVLGDSVCNNIFPQDMNDKYFAHLPSNNGTTACGTYVLLKRYLENNPQTKEVYYLNVPTSFANNMSYQYFVLPFCEPEYMKFFEEETIETLYEKFGSFFVNNSFVKTVLRNNNLLMLEYIDYIKGRPLTDRTNYSRRLARTSIIYLAKIRELCREHNVKLYVSPMPIRDIPSNHDWEKLDEDIKTYGFEDIMGNFTKSIIFYPEDWFRDGVHFKREILNKHRLEIRDAVIESARKGHRVI